MATTLSEHSRSVEVFFAPLPDEHIPPEDSAAFEFARRALEIFKGGVVDDSKLLIQISRLTDNLKQVLELTTDTDLVLVVVSCGADGSIHRDARKLTRQLCSINEYNKANSGRFAVALLGHAVCHSSANQMDNEIFRAGRKLAKVLGADKSLGTLLDTQVELESPEEKFDPFVRSLGNELQVAIK